MYSLQRIRRSSIFRLLALALLAASCYALSSKSTTKTSSAHGNVRLEVATLTPSRPNHNFPVNDQAPATTHNQGQYRHRTQRIHEGSHSEERHRLPKAPIGDESPQPQAVLSQSSGAIDARRIGEALETFEGLMLEVRLSKDPVPSDVKTGEERLRRSGSKSRILDMVLRIWERVHFLDNGHRIQMRTNITEVIDDGGFDEIHKVHTLRLYEKLQQLFTSLSTELFPYFIDDVVNLHASFKYAGRGIVMTAGNDQAHYLSTTIPTFRKLGCTLPIEIMYLGDDDLSVTHQDELRRIPGVVLRDLLPMVNSKGWSFTTWSAKPFAILLSSFREVLFVDADSFFFVNPESLFSDSGYISTGALFFPDRNEFPDNTQHSFLESVLPPPISEKAKESRFWTGEAQHMQESGVVIVDKWRHFVAMLLVTRMNGPDRDTDKRTGVKGFYDIFYGDKESFWLGFELAGDVQYTFHTGRCGIMGAHERHASPTGRALQLEILGYNDKELDNSINPNFDGFVICSAQLVHLDDGGRPIWFNGWISKNKYTGSHEVADFRSFIIESTRDELPEAWDLGKDNVGCLRGDRVVEFSRRERAILDMIIETVKENRALDL